MRLRQEFGLMKRRLSGGKTVWYYWIYDDRNRRIYRSTGQKTKAKALEYVLSLRDSGTLGGKDRCMVLLRDFCKDFFIPGKCPIERNATLRGKSMKKSTLSVRRTALCEHILPHLGGYPVSGINRRVINQWLMDLPEKDKISRTTSNAAKVALSLVMAEAVRQALVPSNPCEKVENLGSDTTRRKAFTLDEVHRIIGKPEDWQNPLIRLMCLISATTGMRIGEVRALKRDCITDSSIIIKASFNNEDGYTLPKNGKTRIAPIPPSLRDEILAVTPPDDSFIFCMLKDKPMSSDWVKKCLAKRMKALGISGKTFHGFREFFNTQMMSANVNETVVRAVMGHSKADMTERYLHVETAEFRQIRSAQLSLMDSITSFA